MQFNETKTYRNLARAFAGESQAGMRYQIIARMATQQGYATLAETIKAIAKNETVHARRFFEELTKLGGKLDNIELDAGYPFHSGDICEGLNLSALDEREEHSKIYPTFANEAKQEGFSEVAALFNMVANVEKRHEEVFNCLHQAFKDGTLFKSKNPTIYVCSECGHMYLGTQAWDVCPLCKASQGYVELHLPS